MWKVLNATCNMQHATFLRQLASCAVKMIYGTFQCKLWHSLAQTMAVCMFCQKLFVPLQRICKCVRVKASAQHSSRKFRLCVRLALPLQSKSKMVQNPTNSAQIWKILTQQKLSKTLTLFINFKTTLSLLYQFWSFSSSQALRSIFLLEFICFLIIFAVKKGMTWLSNEWSIEKEHGYDFKFWYCRG